LALNNTQSVPEIKSWTTSDVPDSETAGVNVSLVMPFPIQRIQTPNIDAFGINSCHSRT
jgi:hypothetical protein